MTLAATSLMAVALTGKRARLPHKKNAYDVATVMMTTAKMYDNSSPSFSSISAIHEQILSHLRLKRKELIQSYMRFASKHFQNTVVRKAKRRFYRR